MPQFVRLHVLPEEIGRYSVTFSRIGETDFDPKLALFSLGPTPSMPEIQSNCLAKESNDDENDFQLNSRISSDFLAGEYFIWLGIFGGSGPGQLVISRADTTQSIAENPPQSLEVEAAPPPAEEITPLTDPVPDVQTPPQP